MTITITKKEIFNGLIVLLKWLRLPVAIVLAGLIVSPRFWEFWLSVDVDYVVVLEYLKVVVSWPSIVLIIFLISKKFIPQFLENVDEFRAGNVGAKMRRPTNDVPASAVEEISEGDSVMPADSSEPTLDDLSLLETDETKNAYKEIYQGMYGTQLLVMKRLRDHIPVGLPANALLDLFEAHKVSKKDHYSSIQQFIQYLQDTSLVIYDTVEGKYRITYAGVYFLKFLMEIGEYYKAPKY